MGLEILECSTSRYFLPPTHEHPCPPSDRFIWTSVIRREFLRYILVVEEYVSIYKQTKNTQDSSTKWDNYDDSDVCKCDLRRWGKPDGRGWPVILSAAVRADRSFCHWTGETLSHLLALSVIGRAGESYPNRAGNLGEDIAPLYNHHFGQRERVVHRERFRSILYHFN